MSFHHRHGGLPPSQLCSVITHAVAARGITKVIREN
jgi:hypothetical protein